MNPWHRLFGRPRVRTVTEELIEVERPGERDVPEAELPEHIRGGQEKVREEGMCGTVFVGSRGQQVMCIRPVHHGPHES